MEGAPVAARSSDGDWAYTLYRDITRSSMRSPPSGFAVCIDLPPEAHTDDAAAAQAWACASRAAATGFSPRIPRSGYGSRSTRGPSRSHE